MDFWPSRPWPPPAAAVAWSGGSAAPGDVVVPAAVAMTTAVAGVVIAAAIAVEDVVAAAIAVEVVAEAAVVAVVVVVVSPRKIQPPTTWDTVLCLPAMVVAIAARAAVHRIKEIRATWVTQPVLRLARSRIPITQLEARATF
jgi:hypothetical protein